MNTKTILLLIALAVLLLGVGGASWVVNHFWNTSADTVNAGRTEQDEGVVCTGYVDLEHGLRSLAPLRPGRVAKILAQENEHISAGTPILQLEDQDAKYQLEEAEAALTTAEVQLEQARKLDAQQQAQIAQQQAAIQTAGFRLEAGRETLKRKEAQVKDNLVSSEEINITRNEVKALEAQQRAEREKLAELKTVDPELMVRKAQANRKLARVRRDLAQSQLDECTLKAPTSGTVLHIAVGAGDIVSGNPAQQVVRFQPDEKLLIRAEVTQEFANRVKVGQAAVIQDDTHSGADWRGKVERVNGWFEQRRPNLQDPTAYNDVRTVGCLISIDPDQPPLRIGQRMRVMIGRVPSVGEK